MCANLEYDSEKVLRQTDRQTVPTIEPKDDRELRLKEHRKPR